jgi:hypothetical protein
MEYTGEKTGLALKNAAQDMLKNLEEIDLKI